MKHEQLRHLRNLRLLLSQDKTPIALFMAAGCPQSVKDGSGKPILPDMAGLIKKINEKHGTDAPDALFPRLNSELASAGVNSSNLEDILSFVRSMKAVANGGSVRGFSKDELSSIECEICQIISDSVSGDLPDGENSYRQLARWVCSIDRTVPIEIFTTNYDLLIEQAFEEKGIPYFDGFSGSRYPFFDIHSVEGNDMPSYWARLWKLHGSINWKYEGDAVCRLSKGVGGSPELIYPSRLKYDQSRKMPFLAMSDRLTHYLLKDHATLIICGYSFNDEHINDTIIHSLKVNPSANAIALMYGASKNDKGDYCHDMAIRISKERPNLSLWYDDVALIATQEREWTEFKDEKDEFKDFSFKMVNNCVSLGDFALFTSFLNHLIGDESNSEK